MGIESLIVFILIGAIAGWLAGQLVKGYGFGLIGNIAVGIVGAFIAGLLFPALGLSLGGGILAAIIHATIGAVILLVLIKLVSPALRENASRHTPTPRPPQKEKQDPLAPGRRADAR